VDTPEIPNDYTLNPLRKIG